MAHIVYTVDIVDIVVVGVGTVGLLLCGIAFAALWVKQELEERRKK